MQDTQKNRISQVFIALSIIFGCLWIGYSIQVTSNSQDYAYLSKSLITQDEAAQYLSLNPEVFDKLILNDAIKRSKLTSYDTYAFLPYVYVNENRYFNPRQIDLWVEYNSISHSRFKTQ